MVSEEIFVGLGEGDTMKELCSMVEQSLYFTMYRTGEEQTLQN